MSKSIESRAGRPRPYRQDDNFAVFEMLHFVPAWQVLLLCYLASFFGRADPAPTAGMTVSRFLRCFATLQHDKRHYFYKENIFQKIKQFLNPYQYKDIWHLCGKREDRLWGGKPHSFGELKLTSSQATLISRCHCENYWINFIFLARLWQSLR